jgi:hypothetical protein
LCEAKHTLNPELIGQAVVYRELAGRAGGLVLETIVFAERADVKEREVDMVGSYYEATQKCQKYQYAGGK